MLKQESAAQFLEEAARALARFKCCAMFMTQQVSDFDSPAAQAVKNNAGNYVLLQQNPEQIGIIADLFDLTEQERRLLSKVHRRDTWGEAFLWQPDGRAASSAWCRIRSCAGWRARSRTSAAPGRG